MVGRECLAAFQNLGFPVVDQLSTYLFNFAAVGADAASQGSVEAGVGVGAEAEAAFESVDDDVALKMDNHELPKCQRSQVQELLTMNLGQLLAKKRLMIWDLICIFQIYYLYLH